VETLSCEGYNLDSLSAAIGYNEKRRKNKSRVSQGRPMKKTGAHLAAILQEVTETKHRTIGWVRPSTNSRPHHYRAKNDRENRNALVMEQNRLVLNGIIDKLRGTASMRADYGLIPAARASA
jgi:hypothetical protein